MTVTPVKVWADDASGSVKYYIDGIEILGAAGTVTLAQLAGYTRGDIIRGGALAWEDYAIGAASSHLESDGTDITWQANLTMADDTWIGLGAAKGRFVFDDTPSPDQIEITAADLNFATASHGIIHTDGVAAGMVLRADGTRYVPSAAASTIPIAPVAQGDIIIADATPEWSVLTLGAQYTHLEAGAATATWEANITLADDAWVGLGAAAGRFVFNSTPAPDQIQLSTANLHLGGNDLLIDTDGDSYLHASGDDVVDLVLAGASGEFGITINGAEDFTVTANSFNVLTGSGVTMADEAWIGFSGAGRLVFDSTPNPDQVEVTSADLYFATTNTGIIHVDGVAAGYILQSDGTRYIPANPAGVLPIEPVAEGDLIIADSTPEWSIRTLGAAAGYALVTTATTAEWDQTPTWSGLHTFAANIKIETTVPLIYWYENDATDHWWRTGVDSGTFFFDYDDDQDGDFSPYTRIVILTSSSMVVNEAGADIDFRVEASGVADALEVQGNDGQITLGALGAGFVKADASGVLSNAAEVTLAEFADYARGSIIRGGAADWEAYAAETDGAILIGDGTDIVSDTTPSIAGLVTLRAGVHILDDQTLIFGTGSDGTIEYDENGTDQVRVAGADWVFEPNIYISDGGTVGQSAGPLLTFDDTNDELEITQCNVGVGGAPGNYHFRVVDETLSSAATFCGIGNVHIKTAGAGAAGDDYYGMLNRMKLDQATTIDYIYGQANEAIVAQGTVSTYQLGATSYAMIDGGTVGNVIGHQMVADINAGTVTGSVIGGYSAVDIEAAVTSIGVHAVGHWIDVDADKDPGGLGIALFMNEGSNIDFGIFQAGTALNYFGGDIQLYTSGKGIIHVDGNTAGYVLRADGTRYVPADPVATLPLAPVAQGDLIVADATPEWSILTLGAAAGYAFVTTATTAAWDQTPTWTGLHTFNAGAHIIDDQTLIFGTGSDGTIEYDEDGTNQVRVAGADWIFEPSVFISPTDAVTAAVTTVLTLEHNTSGTAAVGFGVDMEFQLEDAAGGQEEAGNLAFLLTDATNGAENSLFRVNTIFNSSPVGYMGAWSRSGINATGRVVVPGGTGDIVRGVRWGAVVYRDPGGGGGSADFATSGGDLETPAGAANTVDVYDVGGNTLTLQLNNTGELSIYRSADDGDAYVYDVALWMIWI